MLFTISDHGGYVIDDGYIIDILKKLCLVQAQAQVTL